MGGLLEGKDMDDVKSTFQKSAGQSSLETLRRPRLKSSRFPPPRTSLSDTLAMHFYCNSVELRNNQILEGRKIGVRMVEERGRVQQNMVLDLVISYCSGFRKTIDFQVVSSCIHSLS